MSYRDVATVKIVSMEHHPQGWEIKFAFSGLGRGLHRRGDSSG